MTPRQMTPPRITAPWLVRRETQAVFSALARAGHEARAVGGAVRNTLIGKPVADIDLATTATPEQTMAAGLAAGLSVAPTGLAHGTVTLVANHIPHEVTTLREDVDTDGRHATVAFTDDWAADARRRDFTINALYCAADGQVHDPLDGYADLVARRVRFIGDAQARIREDFLRILRFFRFTAEYVDAAPDAAGLAACNALMGGLAELSAERIHAEVLRILGARRAVEIAAIMHEHGYWIGLFGGTPTPERLARLVAVAVAQSHEAWPMLRLAALAVTSLDDTARVGRRLKLANVERHTLRAAVQNGLQRDPHDLRVALYQYGTEAIVAGHLWHWADGTAPVDDPALGATLRAATSWPIPRLPISGQDVLSLGVPPGPRVGLLLREIEGAWITSDFATSRAALLKQLAAKVATSA